MTLSIDDACQFITKEGTSFFKSARAKDLIVEFGDLRLPKHSTETKQCEAVLTMFADYLQRETTRPLSIAVFGPPGSGKSVTVRKLASLAAESVKNAKLEGPEVINLSQCSSPKELAKALLGVFSLTKPDVTRLVFFDEFDSSLDGEKLGWLKLFLAPMQDGIFSYDGKPIAIGKAIFVFAGGTSETFDEFNRYGDADFIDAKGPDFASRLRGFINSQGLNKHDDERILRRALVLYYQLGKRSKSLLDSSGAIKIEESLLKRILLGAHYKHESRSMEAMLDMCELTGKTKFIEVNLAPVDQLGLHVGRGVLDGVTVAVAAGQYESTAFFPKFAGELLLRGGNLAHGGDLIHGGPLRTMIKELKNAPEELVKRDPGEKRIANYLAYPSCRNPEFMQERNEEEVTNIVKFVEHPVFNREEVDLWELDSDSNKDAFKSMKDEYFKPYLNASDGENKNPDPMRHMVWSIGLFRMRLRLIQDTQALVVVGGKTRFGWGRFPGVAEEVMLAIAHKRPLYILGGAGMDSSCDCDSKSFKHKKASVAIGRYLGLDQTQQIDHMFREATPKYFKDYPNYFEVPAHPGLPMNLSELQVYFANHGLESENWVYNGLSVSENRQLFCEHDLGRCVDLIITGLTRWKSQTRPKDHANDMGRKKRNVQPDDTE